MLLARRTRPDCCVSSGPANRLLQLSKLLPGHTHTAANANMASELSQLIESELRKAEGANKPDEHQRRLASLRVKVRFAAAHDGRQSSQAGTQRTSISVQSELCCRGHCPPGLIQGCAACRLVWKNLPQLFFNRSVLPRGKS